MLQKSTFFFLLLSICVARSVTAQSVTANFSASITSGCGTIVPFFQDLSTHPAADPIVSWDWDFGDGTPHALIQSPSHIYASLVDTCYTVTLTIITQSGISATHSKPNYVCVRSYPIINMPTVLSPNPGCIPAYFQVSLDTIGPGYTAVSEVSGFPLYFGGTFTTGPLTNTSPVPITIVLTSPFGCVTDTIFPNFLSALPSPVADFVATATSSCAPPLTTNFTYAGNNLPIGTSYSWFFPGSTSPSPQTGITANTTPPSATAINYQTSGNYDVTLILQAPNGCSDTLTKVGYIGVGAVSVNITNPDTICVGQAYSYSASGASTYVWDFDCDGSIDGNTSSVNYTFATVGNKCIKVVASNGPGCTDSTTINVVVRPVPTASFVVDKTLDCKAPSTFNFNASASTPANVTYSWDFGSGAAPASPFVTNNPNVAVVYSTTGTKTVSLTVMNTQGCKATMSMPNLISIQPPVPNFNALIKEGCVPFALNIINTSTSNDPIVSYAWEVTPSAGVLPPPATQTGANPIFVFNNQGDYDVKLKITTQQGCVDSVVKTTFVQVGSVPQLAFTFAPATICVKQEVQFTSTFTDPAWQYAWDFNYTAPLINSSSSIFNPIYAFPDTGKFSVALEINNNGCRDTLVQSNIITVNGPKAAFSATPSVFCGSPATFSFVNNSKNAKTGLTQYNWFFNNVNFSNVNIPAAVTPINPPNQNYSGPAGQIPIKLKVFSPSTGCSDSVTVNVVNGNPQANFTAPNPLIFCRRDSVLFTNTSTAASQYSWDFGNGQTGFSNGDIKHPFADTGRYTVQLVAIDANNCKDTLVRNQYILIRGPYADFTADSTTGCTPFTTSFHNASFAWPGTNLVSYTWTFGPSSPPSPVSGGGLTSISHTFANSGNYNVGLTVLDNNGCKDTKVKVSYVQATFPIPDFTASDTATCAGATITFTPTQPGSTYTWYFGDQTFAITTGPAQHTYTDTGFYTIKLVVRDANGCTDSLIKTNYIYIEDIVADFVGAPTTAACPPLITYFTNQSQGNIASYLWDFGDNTLPSTLPNPAHIYTYAGVFDVKLVVTHPDGCRDSLVRQQYINLDGPFGIVKISDTTVCPGDTVQFCLFLQRTKDVILQPQASAVFFNTPGVPGLNDTICYKFVYTTPGIWSPQCIIKDAAGCSYQIPNIPKVIVYQPPLASFVALPPNGCTPLNVTFQNTTTNGPGVPPVGNIPISSWQWVFGNGNVSAAQNPPAQNYVTPNNYNATLIATNQQGCKDTAIVPVQAYLQPAADFKADKVVSCAPAAIEFVDMTSITQAVAWSWNFGDGNTATGSDTVVHTYLNDGLYTVSLTVTDANGCVGTTTKTNYIRLRHPIASFVSDSLIGCEPFRTCFFAGSSVSDTLIDTYNWIFGDGSAPVLSNIDSICHTYNNSGQYGVYLEVSDILGCKDDTLIANYITVNQTSTPQAVDMLRATVVNKGTVRVDYKLYPFPDFRQYILYRQNPGTGGWIRVDSTTNANQLTMSDASPFLNCEETRYCYKVLVQNNCLRYSRFDATEQHCTINTNSTQQVDAVRLNWNAYNGWGTGNVLRYDVYRIGNYQYNQSPPMILVGSAPGTQVFYTDSTTICRDSVFYRVVAVQDGGDQQVSWSDVTANQPNHQLPSMGTDMITATVEDDKHVKVVWKPYAGYYPLHYSLEKSQGSTNVWKEIQNNIPLTDTVQFDYDVYVDSLSYAYRVFATDTCGDRSLIGYVGKTILLNASNLEDETPYLTWTHYEKWRYGVQYYEVQVFDEQNDWVRVARIDNDKRAFEDYKTKLFQDNYCYRIVAYELDGNQASSVSNVDCITFLPRIWTPNVFTPNNDGNNDVFMVRGLNIDEFELRIFDRWGKVIFTSKSIDDGWNGYIEGRPAPEGAYAFKITGKGNKGEPFKQNGTVTLMR